MSHESGYVDVERHAEETDTSYAARAKGAQLLNLHGTARPIIKNDGPDKKEAIYADDQFLVPTSGRDYDNRAMWLLKMEMEEAMGLKPDDAFVGDYWRKEWDKEKIVRETQKRFEERSKRKRDPNEEDPRSIVSKPTYLA